MSIEADLGTTIKMDRKNRRILRELIDDSRITYSQLAKKIGLSRVGVKERIEQLLKGGVIKRFTAHVDYQLLGFHNVVVRWKFKDFTTERETAFAEYVKNNPFIARAEGLSGAGGVDFQVDVYVHNPIELSNIIREIRKKFGDIISDYECYDVLKEYKDEPLSRFFFSDLANS